jgi:hypothetical protein
MELAKSLSKVDGAVHISADRHLYGFPCLLDGRIRALPFIYSGSVRVSAQTTAFQLCCCVFAEKFEESDADRRCADQLMGFVVGRVPGNQLFPRLKSAFRPARIQISVSSG